MNNKFRYLQENSVDSRFVTAIHCIKETGRFDALSSEDLFFFRRYILLLRISLMMSGP